MYFITICAHHMDSRFGAVEDGELRMNDAGIMLAARWEQNICRHPGTSLDAFVIMPNHMHAIVFLGTDPDTTSTGSTLSDVVQSFKSLSTVEYTRGVRAGKFPAFDRMIWQRGFHDKILRTDQVLEAARNYIEANPGKWIEQHT